MSDSNRSILGCFAHPDDEVFMMGGIASQYSGQGVQVGIVCGTRGQRGSCGEPPLCSIPELPQVREAELREAVKIVGVQHLHILDYEDQHLWEAPVDEIRRTLVGIIREQRPQVVITFDPYGANMHTDHVAIARFTFDAVAAAADPLWYPELGMAAHRVQRLLWNTTTPVFNLGDLPDPASVPGLDFWFDIRPYSQRKGDSLKAHRTQHQGVEKLFFPNPPHESALWFEAYRQAFGPPVPHLTSDLFAGLD